MGLKAYATVRGGAKFVVLLFSAETGRLARRHRGRQAGPDADRRRVRRGHQAPRPGGRGPRRVLRDRVAGALPARGRVRRAAGAGDPRLRAGPRAPGPVRRGGRLRLLGVPVVPVDRPEAAARDASILVTITSSRTPVLEGRWIEPGAHVNAAGSNALQRAELDVEAVRRASLVVTDSLEQARLECGDLVAALEQGAIRWETSTSWGRSSPAGVPGRTGRRRDHAVRVAGRGDGGHGRRRAGRRPGPRARHGHGDPDLTMRRLAWLMRTERSTWSWWAAATRPCARRWRREGAGRERAGAREGAVPRAGRQLLLHRGRVPLRPCRARGSPAGRPGRPHRRGGGDHRRAAVHERAVPRRPHAGHRGPERRPTWPIS